MSPFLNLEILCDNPDAAKLREMGIQNTENEEYRIGFIRLDDIVAIYPRHVADEGTVISLKNGDTIVTTINTHDLWTLLNGWENEKRGFAEDIVAEFVSGLLQRQ